MPNSFGAIIAGTGSCLPEKQLTNDDLAQIVDTNDEWIVQRTGIRCRRIAGPGESTATLATAAARKALDAGVASVHLVSGVRPDAILAEVFTNEGSGTMLVARLEEGGA